ncbi:hypothetical protein PMIN03_011072 [Paraphaeosphaeria minitans]
MTSKELRSAGYKANNGFHDQRTALQWVRRYIGGFGGDPEEITVSGESAGGCRYFRTTSGKMLTIPVSALMLMRRLTPRRPRVLIRSLPMGRLCRTWGVILTPRRPSSKGFARPALSTNARGSRYGRGQ